MAQGEAVAAPALTIGDGLPARHVLLCRGVTGSTELVDWWRREREPKRPASRTVMVELIAPGTEEPALRWTFSGCHVVQFSHSPLDALTATVLTESLVFEYTNVEIT